MARVDAMNPAAVHGLQHTNSTHTRPQKSVRHLPPHAAKTEAVAQQKFFSQASNTTAPADVPPVTRKRSLDEMIIEVFTKLAQSCDFLMRDMLQTMSEKQDVIQAINKLSKALRDRADKMKETGAKKYDISKDEELQKLIEEVNKIDPSILANGTKELTLDKIESAREAARNAVSLLQEMSETAKLQLQRFSNKHDQYFTAATNLIKTLNEIAQKILGNYR